MVFGIASKIKSVILKKKLLYALKDIKMYLLEEEGKIKDWLGNCNPTVSSK